MWKFLQQYQEDSIVIRGPKGPLKDFHLVNDLIGSNPEYVTAPVGIALSTPLSEHRCGAYWKRADHQGFKMGKPSPGLSNEQDCENQAANPEFALHRESLEKNDLMLEVNLLTHIVIPIDIHIRYLANLCFYQE